MDNCSVESLEYIYTVQKSKAALILSNSVIYQNNLCTSWATFFVCTHSCFVCLGGRRSPCTQITMVPCQRKGREAPRGVTRSGGEHKEATQREDFGDICTVRTIGHSILRMKKTKAGCEQSLPELGMKSSSATEI